MQDLEGAWEKSGSGSEADQKSFGADRKQKGLGFNSCVAPLCTQCPISEHRSDRKGNRGNRSRYDTGGNI